jgi:aryl-alcohol dehydrogenase-like predicted oxidoreductase
MQDLRRAGKLDLVGVSNVTLEGARFAAERVELGEIQNAYSVLDRHNEPVLELCRERGIAFVPFFPLGSAFAAGPQTLAADPAIAGVAAKHGATPSQVALAWLLARHDRILLIPGTTSVAHLEENMAAAHVTLDAQDLEALEGVGQVGRPQR